MLFRVYPALLNCLSGRIPAYTQVTSPGNAGKGQLGHTTSLKEEGEEESNTNAEILVEKH